MSQVPMKLIESVRLTDALYLEKWLSNPGDIHERIVYGILRSDENGGVRIYDYSGDLKVDIKKLIKFLDD